MHRNLTLVEKILTALETAQSKTTSIHELKRDLAGEVDSEVLRYHLKLLADAKFVSGPETGLRLSWLGHDGLAEMKLKSLSAKRQ